MGGAASVDIESDRALYHEIEKNCRSGYFHSHLAEFQNAMQQAISRNALDIVELLIVGGPTRNLNPGPVLLAAKLAQLEVLELLDSAGFDLQQTDGQGRTALHFAAMNTSIEAGNVGTFLALRCGAKLCKVRSQEGSTGVHVAAEMNNADLLHAVLSCLQEVDVKKIVSMPNFDGKSACQIAKFKGNSHLETFMLLNQFLTYGKAEDTPRQVRTGHSSVDPQRMMAVWEAFFENATKRMMAEEAASGESRLMLDTVGPQIAATSMLSAVDDGELAVHRKAHVTSLSPVTYNPRALEQVEMVLRDWFDWTLLHHVDEGGADCYYLLHKVDGRSVWLSDHLYANSVEQGGVVLAASYDQLNTRQRQQVSVVHTDMGLIDTVARAWVNYYDASSNSHLWLNAFTWSCEQTLPLGNDPLLRSITGFPLASSCLGSYYNGTDVAPDPAVSLSWVMVVSEQSPRRTSAIHSEKRTKTKAKSGGDSRGGGVWDIWGDGDEDGLYGHRKRAVTAGEGAESKDEKGTVGEEDEGAPYYWNRLTDITQYSKPAHYDEIIRENHGGWSLVCSPESRYALYWWHEATGESQWA